MLLRRNLEVRDEHIDRENGDLEQLFELCFLFGQCLSRLLRE